MTTGWARARRAAWAAAVAVLAWNAAATLGLPSLVGLEAERGLLPVALLGAVLGATGGDGAPGRRFPTPDLGRLVRAAAVGVAVLLVVVSTLPFAGPLARPLVRRDRPAADSGAAFDAIVVLSAGVNESGRVQGQGLERTLDGIALARRTGRPLVVTVIRSRLTRGLRTGAVTSLADQRELAALGGLGADRLWAVGPVGTTHDEAVQTAALARARGWRRVALVTSPAHTRRACATFERAGLAVVCTPARARDATWDGPAFLRTPGDRLRATAAWMYETVGWAIYRARGWI